jgi:hypothetical protein
VLWLFAVVAWLGYLILKLMEPGVIETILSSGEYEGMKLGHEILLAYAFVLLVLLVMAFLSLTLKYSINRWANIIVGIVVTVVDLGGLIELLPQPSAYSILIWSSKVVVGALIVWYAYKWPKEKT